MHSLIRLALCLLVWLPAAVYAQPVDAPTAPPLITAPPELEAPPALQGELIPRQRLPGQEEGERLMIIPRIVLGTLLGSVASTGGAIVGAFASYGFSDCASHEGSCDEVGAIVPPLLGAWSFSSLTVYGIGRWMSGQGRLLPTLLGGAVGTGVGAALWTRISGPDALSWLGLVAPAIGALVGFELAHAFWEPEPGQALNARTGLQVVPVLGVSGMGSVMGGLTGCF